MKKLLLLLAAVATLASCVQNIEGIDNSLGYTRITVGVPQGRTALGDKDEKGTYNIVWSEEDAIVVNGAKSTKCEIGEDKTSATFSFEKDLLESPFYLTYPHTEGSLCANGKPTVVFQAEQEYVANTFGVGYAPMCGYSENSNIKLNHLAGVLRFTLTGAENLKTIEITADEDVALSGEFDVDCQNGTITPIAGEVSNKIVYTINQTLTNEAVAFYITIPKGLEGVCQIVFTDKAGLKMTSKWTAKGVEAGVVREFKAFAFKGGASLELQEMTSLEDELEIEVPEEPTTGVWGKVLYDDGTPATKVAVSDGFSVVTTDFQGIYHFENGVNARTKYIYLSLPATAKVKNNANNQIDFFKSYSKNKYRYDFTLEKIAKEDKFSLFMIADTHGARAKYVQRVREECLPGVRAEKSSKTTPCYSIILGDIVCAAAPATENGEISGNITEKEETRIEEEKQASYYMPLMRDMFAMENTNNVPTFYVMGNHDHDRLYFNQASTMASLEEFNYHVQDAYENVFGPADYSFNRGDVHIVCMRDIQWNQDCMTYNSSHGEHLSGDFTDAQVEWLRQDLAKVPSNNMVILCVHIPLHNASGSNVSRVGDLIKQFDKRMIFSGHNHRNNSILASSSNIGIDEMKFVGNWGFVRTRCGIDGTPFGFGVYDFSNGQITSNYFRACSLGENTLAPKDYQMRVYLSDMVSGKEGANLWHGSYYYNSRYIYANIFNGNANWNVSLKIYNASGRQLGSTYELTHLDMDYANAWKTGDGTKTNPYRASSSSNTCDCWAVGGYYNGVQTSWRSINCYGMFRSTSISSTYFNGIKNGTYTFEVVATDPYGNTHTCTKLWDADDIPDYLVRPGYWN
ncbi:MAG: calcineurin-like phosphoesterase C-terminal domain-containing protein [Alistipes sp.]|nr:calcineurin-like phosphoesterase C-terminal domain-containing protein [Alistipes sp.]